MLSGHHMTTSKLSAAQIANLSVIAIQGLTKTDLASLTATQIGALSTTGIATLDATQLRALDTTQLQRLMVTQVPFFQSSMAFNTARLMALSGQQIGVLAATRLAELDANKLTEAPVTDFSLPANALAPALNPAQKAPLDAGSEALTGTPRAASARVNAVAKAAGLSRETVATATVPLIALALAGLTLFTPVPRLALGVFAISLAIGAVALGWLRHRWKT